MRLIWRKQNGIYTAQTLVHYSEVMRYLNTQSATLTRSESAVVKLTEMLSLLSGLVHTSMSPTLAQWLDHTAFKTPSTQRSYSTGTEEARGKKRQIRGSVLHDSHLQRLAHTHLLNVILEDTHSSTTASIKTTNYSHYKTAGQATERERSFILVLSSKALTGSWKETGLDFPSHPS